MQDFVMHGMNITKLRQLTLSCLGMSSRTMTITPSPKMAVFFAGIVHSKTNAFQDAYFYARALLLNEQPKRAVKWMEQSKLLRCYYETASTSSREGDFPHSNSSNNKVKEMKALQVEALLLSAQALVELHDFTAVLQLLEDTQHYTFPETNYTESHPQQAQQQAQQQHMMDHPQQHSKNNTNNTNNVMDTHHHHDDDTENYNSTNFQNSNQQQQQQQQQQQHHSQFNAGMSAPVSYGVSNNINSNPYG